MIGCIAVASIACVDSFFIALLISRSSRLRTYVLLASPPLHALFCLAGMLMQQSAGSLMGRGLFGVVILIVLTAGGYLAVLYRPHQKMAHNLRHKNDSSISFVTILVLFCALDALIPGFVYGYWQMGYGQAAACMGAVNAIAVLGALLLGSRTMRPDASM